MSGKPVQVSGSGSGGAHPMQLEVAQQLACLWVVEPPPTHSAAVRRIESLVILPSSARNRSLPSVGLG